MRQIVAIIVGVTALLAAVAADVLLFAGTGTHARKPISADLDETSGSGAQTDQPRLFQCFDRDLYPRASIQSELRPQMRDWHENLAIGACY